MIKLIKRIFAVAFLCLAALPLAPRVSAQTPPVLDLQFYPGVSITGTVGAVYLVESVTELAQTNSWRCLEFLRPLTSPFTWVDKSAPPTGSRFYRTVVDVRTNLLFIPPGSFWMGSPSNEVDREPLAPLIVEGPQTAVTISKGFWMGKYEVTQGEYLAVTGNNPSGFTGDANPVETVSWYDATNYCGKLTERERASGRIAANSVYRLPTEAEWEYACRAWTSTRFSFGDDPGYDNLARYAWYEVNSGGMTHPVGQKLPNAWGLYDMQGNVVEWCQDWYGPYAGGTALDPQGPATGSLRVARGGLWLRPANYCRSAWRNGVPPSLMINGAGFRVVLAIDQP